MTTIMPGDWVRLKHNCDMHPSKPKPYQGYPGEAYRREFIGIYLGKHRVQWLSAELPEQEDSHWNQECLELLQRAPKGVGDAV